MLHINIKPLSVNEAWQGRRFKTDKYKRYENALLFSLPHFTDFTGFDAKDKLSITMEFGFSNKASDIDNPVKPFMDILQKKYGFNDKNVYELILKKRIVPKGGESIAFNIKQVSLNKDGSIRKIK